MAWMIHSMKNIRQRESIESQGNGNKPKCQLWMIVVCMFWAPEVEPCARTLEHRGCTKADCQNWCDAVHRINFDKSAGGQ
jgi:hypothetical protein